MGEGGNTVADLLQVVKQANIFYGVGEGGNRVADLLQVVKQANIFYGVGEGGNQGNRSSITRG